MDSIRAWILAGDFHADTGRTGGTLVAADLALMAAETRSLDVIPPDMVHGNISRNDSS